MYFPVLAASCCHAELGTGKRSESQADAKICRQSRSPRETCTAGNGRGSWCQRRERARRKDVGKGMGHTDHQPYSPVSESFIDQIYSLRKCLFLSQCFSFLILLSFSPTLSIDPKLSSPNPFYIRSASLPRFVPAHCNLRPTSRSSSPAPPCSILTLSSPSSVAPLPALRFSLPKPFRVHFVTSTSLDSRPLCS